MKPRQLAVFLAALVLLVGAWALFSRPASGSEGLAVGQRPPDFRLTDAFGRTITRTSLVGDRPGLIFFTATWCAPCVEGLRDLLRFQEEAKTPFRVLLVFIDPNETEADLRAYKARYGFPDDWYYALDRDGMLTKYQVRYLDTKFLLDAQGITRYTDFRPANYATWKLAFSKPGLGKGG
ncbi:MAG: TlpA family protein disulfide reductase [Deinococcota bacterium]